MEPVFVDTLGTIVVSYVFVLSSISKPRNAS